MVSFRRSGCDEMLSILCVEESWRFGAWRGDVATADAFGGSCLAPRLFRTRSI